MLVLGTGGIHAMPDEPGAQSYLEQSQNEDGSWGDAEALQPRDTAVVLDSLQRRGAAPASVALGRDYLASRPIANNDLVSRMARLEGLAGPSGRLGSLLSTRRPAAINTNIFNYPEGGWGIAEHFQSDVLDTALVLQALSVGGFRRPFASALETAAVSEEKIHALTAPAQADRLSVLFLPGQQQVFFDDMESGVGSFSSVELVGSNGWVQSASKSFSGTTSWYVENIATASDSALVLAPIVDLPRDATLSFRQFIDAEEAYDGGVLEYSTDGVIWQDAEPLLIQGFYNGDIPLDEGSPLAGRVVWTFGHVQGWLETRVDLSAFEGADISFRWRFATDFTDGADGWYIDDVRILTEAEPAFEDGVAALEVWFTGPGGRLPPVGSFAVGPLPQQLDWSALSSPSFAPGAIEVHVLNPGGSPGAASYAIEVFTAGSGLDGAEVREAVEYLRQARNPGAGWGIQVGSPTDLFISLHAIRALQVYEPGSAADPIAWLATQANPDGGFGPGGSSTAYETALAYEILADDNAASAAAIAAHTWLDNNQLPDGSWDDDPYSTALALRALLAGQTDSDQDFVPDSIDNCDGTLTLDQTDTDGDGAGDVCDADDDDDGEPDLTDNCPKVANPAQLDVDADGEGDFCDPDDGLVSSFFWVQPKTIFTWPPEEGAHCYSVYRGLLSELSLTNYGSCWKASTFRDTDRDGNLDEFDDGIPPLNDGFFYLITATTEAGEGSSGRGSDGLPRPNPTPCPGGVCAACVTSDECDDGVFCNGAEACVDGMCQSGAPPTCDDGIDCTVDGCNDVIDACSNAPDDSFCDDGLFCTGAEICNALSGCQAGAKVCPTNVCDEPTDSCVPCVLAGDCDDGLYCNGVETCNSGVCEAGTPVVCDDGVPCTADACNEDTDSCDAPPDDAACSDGLFCNGAETCDPVLDCQPAVDPCGGFLCDEENNWCVQCLDDADCDDGLYCTGSESCQSGVCVLDSYPCSGLSCDDALETCVDNLSLLPGVVATATSQASGGYVAANAVDGVNTAVSSWCKTSADVAPVLTIDLPSDQVVTRLFIVNSWTPSRDFLTAQIKIYDSLAGELYDTGVIALTDGGLDLTIPATAPARSVEFIGLTWNVSEPCLSEFEIIGTAVECSSSPECDDGLFCNGAETCAAGLCVDGTPVDCSDGVDCTYDSCNESTELCEHAPGNGLCNDGLFCNGEEYCDAILDCQSGTAPAVDDGVACTDDLCDEANDTVVHLPNDGSCDDGLFCNGAETCDALAGCQAGTSPVLDDGIACTTDSCDESRSSVIHEPVDATCDDGFFCTGVESCNPLAGCETTGDPCTGLYCNEGLSVCTGFLDNAASGFESGGSAVGTNWRTRAAGAGATAVGAAEAGSYRVRGGFAAAFKTLD